MDEAFNEFSEVDFEKKMILLHCYTTTNSCSRGIKDIILSGNKLKIEYGIKCKCKHKYGVHPPNGSPPYTKWVIVKLDYIEIDSVEFKFIGKV